MPDTTSPANSMPISRRAAIAPIERKAYTIDEAAQALGISRRTLERRIADGSIRVIRKFGRPLIPAAELSGEEEAPSRHAGRR
jgi:excisionase family DNA binding protein